MSLLAFYKLILSCICIQNRITITALHSKFFHSRATDIPFTATLKYLNTTGALGPTWQHISHYFRSCLSRPCNLSHIFSHITRWSRTMSVRLTKETLLLASKMLQQRKWSYFLTGTVGEKVRPGGWTEGLVTCSYRMAGRCSKSRKASGD